jgi:hypothetical protein
LASHEEKEMVAEGEQREEQELYGKSFEGFI